MVCVDFKLLQWYCANCLSPFRSLLYAAERPEPDGIPPRQCQKRLRRRHWDGRRQPRPRRRRDWRRQPCPRRRLDGRRRPRHRRRCLPHRRHCQHGEPWRVPARPSPSWSHPDRMCRRMGHCRELIASTTTHADEFQGLLLQCEAAEQERQCGLAVLLLPQDREMPSNGEAKQRSLHPRAVAALPPGRTRDDTGPQDSSSHGGRCPERLPLSRPDHQQGSLRPRRKTSRYRFSPSPSTWPGPLTAIGRRYTLKNRRILTLSWTPPSSRPTWRSRKGAASWWPPTSSCRFYKTASTGTWTVPSSWFGSPFHQLFSIHGFVRSGDCCKQVPLLFCLMSGKTKKLYEKVLKVVLKLLRGDPKVKRVTLDFGRPWRRS